MPLILIHAQSSHTEQLEKDIDAAKETLEEAKSGAAKLRKELSKLADELNVSEVRV